MLMLVLSAGRAEEVAAHRRAAALNGERRRRWYRVGCRGGRCMR